MTAPTWQTECDDLSEWITDGRLPTVEESNWVYRLAKDENVSIDNVTRAKAFGFGTYEIRFKVSGYRPNLNHYCPLWLVDNDSIYPEPWEEVDFPEMYGRNYAGETVDTKQLEMTTYHLRYSNKSGTDWYNSHTNFEDGQYHTMRIEFSKTRIKQYMDGTLDKDWTLNPATVPDCDAKPLNLFCSVYGSESHEAFTLWIDWIKYWKNGGENTGSKTGSGKVSAQAQTGETVTVTVTKPDNTKVALTALTDASGAYSVTFTGDPGTYTAVATTPADSKYQSATSPTTTFTLTAEARTITLTWT